MKIENNSLFFHKSTKIFSKKGKDFPYAQNCKIQIYDFLGQVC